MNAVLQPSNPRSASRIARAWMRLTPDLLPFADAASDQLPLSRLLRLSLFQVSVGMATVLLIGTLNRVLIVELGLSAWLVSLMVALPLTLFTTKLYPAGTVEPGGPVRINSCDVPDTVAGGEIVPLEAVTARVPAAAKAFAICCATVAPVPELYV